HPSVDSNHDSAARGRAHVVARTERWDVPDGRPGRPVRPQRSILRQPRGPVQLRKGPPTGGYATTCQLHRCFCPGDAAIPALGERGATEFLTVSRGGGRLAPPSTREQRDGR